MLLLAANLFQRRPAWIFLRLGAGTAFKIQIHAAMRAQPLAILTADRLEGHGEIDLRLSWAEALHAAGRAEDARATLSATLPHLRKRLDNIPEPLWRARYLANVPANARVVVLAGAWLGDEAVRALDA